MPNASYSIARAVLQDGDCFVGPDDTYAGKAFAIASGNSALANHPKDLVLPMAPKFKGKNTPDALANQMNFLLASDRLTALLQEELGKGEAEWLPFRLQDHKKKLVPGFGTIVNLLGTVDCVDATASVGRRAAMKADRFMTISVLAIDAAKVPKARKLFRIQDKPDVLLIRDDLRQRIEKEKLTGLSYFALGAKLPPMTI